MECVSTYFRVLAFFVEGSVKTEIRNDVVQDLLHFDQILLSIVTIFEDFMNLFKIWDKSFNRVKIFQIFNTTFLNLINDIDYFVFVDLLIKWTKKNINLGTITCYNISI